MLDLSSRLLRAIRTNTCGKHFLPPQVSSPKYNISNTANLNGVVFFVYFVSFKLFDVIRNCVVSTGKFSRKRIKKQKKKKKYRHSTSLMHARNSNAQQTDLPENHLLSSTWINLFFSLPHTFNGVCFFTLFPFSSLRFHCDSISA